MGNSISNFIELLTKGDFFLIFLIVMMVVIIGVIVYLVRLQINDAPEFTKKDKEDDEDYEYEFKVNKEETPLKEESFKVTSSILDAKSNPVEKYKEEPEEKEESIFKYNDEYNDEKEESVFKYKNDRKDLIADEYTEEEESTNDDLILESPKRHIEQSRFVFDEEEAAKSIKSYEDEQEQNAIISASELESRLSEMRTSGKLENHEKEIAEYEKEQETKAIISYEELLERAGAGVVSYESEESIGGIKVGKVDTSQIETIKENNEKPYYREEAFLEAMKEFRRAL